MLPLATIRFTETTTTILQLQLQNETRKETKQQSKICRICKLKSASEMPEMECLKFDISYFIILSIYFYVILRKIYEMLFSFK